MQITEAPVKTTGLPNYMVTLVGQVWGFITDR